MKPKTEIPGPTPNEKLLIVKIYYHEINKGKRNHWNRIAKQATSIWSKARQREFGIEGREELIDYLSYAIHSWIEPLRR